MKRKQKLPKQFQLILNLADKCILAMIQKGETPKDAEQMVLTTIKESVSYLEQGMYKEVKASLKMIYLDVSTESVISDLLK